MTPLPRGRRPDDRGAYRYFAALERFDLTRNPATGLREERLPDELGAIHAMRLRETPDTRREAYFEARGPFALCGTHVKVRLPVTFRGEEDEACPGCAKRVAEGATRAPQAEGYYACEAVVLPDLPGFSGAVSCFLPDRHDGPHRTREGGTWTSGPEDFTPTGNYST
ncbi:hypothetical protein ACK8HX_13185 [Oryzobacter sp. R7]|uniref:hypothetical protein n=1 Tax=Oryzobacter faecalis TaxID=3388656 RepID=UPI00398C8DAA